jgi:hypothetical protein
MTKVMGKKERTQERTPDLDFEQVALWQRLVLLTLVCALLSPWVHGWTIFPASLASGWLAPMTKL